jgi:low temperature requirement protein LtrA
MALMRPLVAPLRLRSQVGGAHDRKVTWLELFFDLVFVAAVAQVAAPLHEHYSLAGLVRFTPLFALIWWAWTGHTVFSTRFDPDDALQRVLTLVQMFAVAVMAANAKDALDSTESAGFAAAYAAVRLVLVAQYFRARQVPEARALATRYLAGHGIAAVLWLTSALVPTPERFWIWGAAFALDLGTPWLAVPHTVKAPPDAAHLPERFGLFTLILLGESVVAVMRGMESQEGWPPGAAVSAFLGMGIAFVIWWWYFDGAAGAAEQPVRTQREALRFHIWTYAHFPLALGIVVAGVGVQLIVTAAARAELAAAEAMLLAAALSLVMVAVTVVGATSGNRQRHGWFDAAAHGVIAAATLGLGLLAPMTSPVNLIVVIAMLATAQLALSLSQRHGTLRETVVTSGYGDGDIPSTRIPDEPFRYRSKNATV